MITAQGSVPDDVYRLFFFQSRWPSLIVDRTLSSILDVNQAWQDLSFPSQEDLLVRRVLKLDLALEHIDQAQLCQAQFVHQPENDHFLCQIMPLKNNLLSIECYWPEQNSLSREYEHLKNLNQRKSDLIANISHELRTPLTAILGWPEILLDTQGMPGLAVQAAEAIRKDGVFLRDLLEDLIDLSKIEAGHLNLDIKPENLCMVAIDAIEMLTEKAREKNLKLDIQLPEQAVIAQIDTVRIMQVLLNYLSNAIKYTPSGGHICLSLTSKDTEAVISICDNGIGMNETIRKKAFERFMRAEEVSLLDGAGIGLSLVKKLVQLHKGHCWVESTAGVGSCFYVALPLSKQLKTRSENPTIRAEEQSTKLTQQSIILISEHIEERLFLEQLLNTSIKNIYSFSEPSTCLTDIKDKVIMLSTSLEKQSHLNWLAQFRKQDPNTPVIALSSSAMKGDQEKLLNKGYSAVLMKPFLKQDLLQCIQQILTETSDV